MNLQSRSVEEMCLCIPRTQTLNRNGPEWIRFSGGIYPNVHTITCSKTWIYEFKSDSKRHPADRLFSGDPLLKVKKSKRVETMTVYSIPDICDHMS